MSTGGLFLLAAFFIGVIAFILWPVLVAPRTVPSESVQNEAFSHIKQLQAEREALLIGIRDLDFDFQTGKFTEEDYRSQRETLVERGVAVLKQIDAERSQAIESAVWAQRKS
ncbi:MAG: hypothetical protein ABI947_01225 [Chloroflexota bacterium]